MYCYILEGERKRGVEGEGGEGRVGVRVGEVRRRMRFPWRLRMTDTFLVSQKNGHIHPSEDITYLYMRDIVLVTSRKI